MFVCFSKMMKCLGTLGSRATEYRKTDFLAKCFESLAPVASYAASAVLVTKFGGNRDRDG